MNDHTPMPYQSNPATFGTTPVEYFEDTSGDLPAGTTASPRPADRPRELPSPPGGKGWFGLETLAGTDLGEHVSSEVRAQFAELVGVIREVCPDCVATCRGDGAWIFVPPERMTSATNKNLITVWPRTARLRLRIMPEPEEAFGPEKLSAYRDSLRRLLDDLLD
jgi:hypothetical protein